MKRAKLCWGMFAKWTAEAVTFAGISQAELGRRLTERLRRGIDSAAVNKIIKGDRALAADEMLAIAEITNYPVLISLGGKKLEKPFNNQSVNEPYLVRLVSFALEWLGLSQDVARNLSAALVSAARKHPDREGTDLSDDQLRQVAQTLIDVLGPQRPQG
jgi:hypothetical protein